MSSILPLLAHLYIYPSEQYRAKVAAITDYAADYSDSVYIPTRRFFDWIATTQQSMLEESFTTTFDLNPACNPEVGWHIWGEDYNRGAFMADLRDEFTHYEIEEQGELPDHLIHILPLVAAMEFDVAQRFSREIVLPALAAMHKQLKDQQSHFADLVEATYYAVKEHAEIEEEIAPPDRRGKGIEMVFSKSLATPSAQGGFE